MHGAQMSFSSLVFGDAECSRQCLCEKAKSAHGRFAQEALLRTEPGALEREASALYLPLLALWAEVEAAGCGQGSPRGALCHCACKKCLEEKQRNLAAAIAATPEERDFALLAWALLAAATEVETPAEQRTQNLKPPGDGLLPSIRLLTEHAQISAAAESAAQGASPPEDAPIPPSQDATPTSIILRFFKTLGDLYEAFCFTDLVSASFDWEVSPRAAALLEAGV